MKAFIFILLITGTFLFNSCIHDFEEGADISLRSVERRIEGKWRIKGVWVNGIDSTTYPPYSQYTQKDSLTLTFIFNEPFGPDKVNWVKSSVGQQVLNQNSDWGVEKKVLDIFNKVYGFDHFLGTRNCTSYWTIISCRNERLVLDLESFELYSNRLKLVGSKCILLIEN